MTAILTEYPQFFTATNLEWKKLLKQLISAVGEAIAQGPGTTPTAAKNYKEDLLTLASLTQ